MKSLKACFAGSIILFLLGGCNLAIGQPPQPTPIPTTATPTHTQAPSITPIPAPTQRATFTMFPTITRAPSLTAIAPDTPLPLNEVETIQAKVTEAIASGMPGGPPRAWRCFLDSQYPTLDPIQVMRPRQEFTAIWRVINAGKTQWGTRDVAFFHVSGTALQFKNYREKFIPYVVNVDDQLNLHVDMKAPKDEGVYSAVWSLRSRTTKEFFCTVYIVIIVQSREKQ